MSDEAETMNTKSLLKQAEDDLACLDERIAEVDRDRQSLVDDLEMLAKERDDLLQRVATARAAVQRGHSGGLRDEPVEESAPKPELPTEDEEN